MEKFSVSVVSVKRHLVYIESESSIEAAREAEGVVTEAEPLADYVEVIDIETVK